MQKFSLEDLSQAEHSLISNAYQEFGDAYQNACSSIDLLWNFISLSTEDSWIFLMFLSQVQKNFTVAVLSSVRRHHSASEIAIRYGLEAYLFSCYGLAVPKIDNFGYVKDGVLKENKRAKSNAIKWMNENYSEMSEKLKSIKERINSRSSHLNIDLALNGFEHSGERVSNYFFDQTPNHLIKGELWFISNTVLGLLDFYIQIIEDYPGIEFVESFSGSLQDLFEENDLIGKKLKESLNFSS